MNEVPALGSQPQDCIQGGVEEIYTIPQMVTGRVLSGYWYYTRTLPRVAIEFSDLDMHEQNNGGMSQGIG
jgi:hypothetical protein